MEILITLEQKVILSGVDLDVSELRLGRILKSESYFSQSFVTGT